MYVAVTTPFLHALEVMADVFVIVMASGSVYAVMRVIGLITRHKTVPVIVVPSVAVVETEIDLSSYSALVVTAAGCP